jgi:hypothetical protein
MPSISINREDAMRVLANPEAAADSRVIAGLTVAFFEAADHASEATPATRQVGLKLAHMIASEIYKGGEG